MPDTFGGFLVASLGAVKRDAPACANAIASAIGPAGIELVVDAERMVVHAGPEIVIVVGPAASDLARRGGLAIHVATTARALLALIDGEDELYAAIVDNRVRVRAARRDAERLFDAMRWFVEGCARTSAAPALLAEYRCQKGPDPDRRPT